MKHLVVCATVPICFPKLPLSELTLTALEDLPFIKGALQKTGLAAGIVDKCDPAPFTPCQVLPYQCMRVQLRDPQELRGTSNLCSWTSTVHTLLCGSLHEKVLLASPMHADYATSWLCLSRGRCTCRFGHAELLDDVIDHWDAKTHKGERAAFVERLQQVARAREARVSFVSGDVHVGGIGRLYTRPKVPQAAHPMPCVRLAGLTSPCTGAASANTLCTSREVLCL